MVAWMDAEALRRTLTTGAATYFSRSRREYWVKGETSGNTQRVVEVRRDCDGDTLLVLVDQTGRRLPHRHQDLFRRRADRTAGRARRTDLDPGPPGLGGFCDRDHSAARWVITLPGPIELHRNLGRPTTVIIRPGHREGRWEAGGEKQVRA